MISNVSVKYEKTHLKEVRFFTVYSKVKAIGNTQAYTINLGTGCIPKELISV